VTGSRKLRPKLSAHKIGQTEEGSQGEKSSCRNNPKIRIGRVSSDLDILESSSLDDFLGAFQVIHERRLMRVSNKSIIQHDDSLLMKRLLRNNRENFDFFPCHDIRFLVRAFAETCPEHAFATYDLTDIVHAGYYEPDDPISELATHSLIGEYPRHGKIIILTEGKTDRRILEDSLHLLYPHLADYFRLWISRCRKQKVAQEH
jgi:hypothetical protein